MQIHIKTLTGRIITIDVEPSNTIQNVKVILQDREGIASEQRLVSVEKQYYKL